MIFIIFEIIIYLNIFLISDLYLFLYKKTQKTHFLNEKSEKSKKIKKKLKKIKNVLKKINIF